MTRQDVEMRLMQHKIKNNDLSTQLYDCGGFGLLYLWWGGRRWHTEWMETESCPVKLDDSEEIYNLQAIKLTAQTGMVNIDASEIAYSDIRNMYKTGDGCGLQLSKRLEHKRGEIFDICEKIADHIYELQDVVAA